MTTRITLLIMTVLLLVPAAVHADDSAQITALFAAVTEDGGIVTIPPGDYLLDGATAAFRWPRARPCRPTARGFTCRRRSATRRAWSCSRART